MKYQKEDKLGTKKLAFIVFLKVQNYRGGMCSQLWVNSGLGA